MREYYELLGLDENATDEEVQARYNELREKYLAFSRERQAENEARYNYNSIVNDNAIKRRAIKCAQIARQRR